MDGRMDRRMGMDGWMGGRMDGCMDVWMGREGRMGMDEQMDRDWWGWIGVGGGMGMEG